MRLGRTLPPAAPAVSPAALVRGAAALLGGASALDRLRAEARVLFQAPHVFFASSGTAALTLIIQALARLSPRRTVVIPAYTCYSVAAAIYRAGATVRVCDVNPETLDFDFGHLERQLDADTLCVVPTHLLGLPADVERTQVLAHGRGALVVEDAAQALGIREAGRPLGTIGDVGFFSLGRGKLLSAGEGGIILTRNAAVADALSLEMANLPDPAPQHTMGTLLALAAQAVLTRPSLYWLPAGVPGLRLGASIYPDTISMTHLGPAQAAALRGWTTTLTETLRVHRRNTELLGDLLCERGWLGAPPAPGTAFLRFPLVLGDADQKAGLCRMGARAGLGVSPLYPLPIPRVPEIRARLAGADCPGAHALADRLITLPVHRFVTRADYGRILSALSQVDSPQSMRVPAPVRAAALKAA